MTYDLSISGVFFNTAENASTPVNQPVWRNPITDLTNIVAQTHLDNMNTPGYGPNVVGVTQSTPKVDGNLMNVHHNDSARHFSSLQNSVSCGTQGANHFEHLKVECCGGWIHIIEHIVDIEPLIPEPEPQPDMA